jgi:hypothetical protein
LPERLRKGTKKMGGTEDSSDTDRVRNIPAPGGEMYGFGPDPKSETIMPTYWRKMKGAGWVPAALPTKGSYIPPEIKGPKFDPKDVPIVPAWPSGNLYYDPNYSGQDLMTLAQGTGAAGRGQDAMVIAALSRLFGGGIT